MTGINKDYTDGECSGMGGELIVVHNFLLFAYGDYYPEGGFNDYQGTYPTYLEAEAAKNQLLVYDRWQIVEVKNTLMTLVASGRFA